MQTVRRSVKTYSLPNGGGPAVYNHKIQNANAMLSLELEAWISNFGGCNVWIFEGILTQAECENLITKEGKVDCVMTVTGSGPTYVPLEDNCRALTIFYEGKNESGQAQGVSIVLNETFQERA